MTRAKMVVCCPDPPPLPATQEVTDRKNAIMSNLAQVGPIHRESVVEDEKRNPTDRSHEEDFLVDWGKRF